MLGCRSMMPNFSFSTSERVSSHACFVDVPNGRRSSFREVMTGRFRITELVTGKSTLTKITAGSLNKVIKSEQIKGNFQGNAFYKH